MKRILLKLTSWALNFVGAERSLKLLFRLDRWLYYFQGQMAIAYGRGEHTKHRHMRYHDFFVNRVNAGEVVLDMGCGMGVVAFQVAERAAALVLGVDIDPASIEKARRRYAHERVDYLVGDVTRLEIDRQVDVVILSNVLEHLTARPELLRRTVQTIHPKRLLIRVPLFERDWRVPLKKELGLEWRLDPTHEIEYTIDSFAQEMKSAGLGIAHQEIRWGEIWAELHPLPQGPGSTAGANT